MAIVVFARSERMAEDTPVWPVWQDPQEDLERYILEPFDCLAVFSQDPAVFQFVEHRRRFLRNASAIKRSLYRRALVGQIPAFRQRACQARDSEPRGQVQVPRVEVGNVTPGTENQNGRQGRTTKR